MIEKDKPLLALSHIHKQYHDATSAVLQDVSLEIAPGEFCCILGKSGCGTPKHAVCDQIQRARHR